MAQISARTQSIYANISDIISLNNPSLNDVNTTYANAQKSLDETIENMGVFNQTVADSGIADLIAAQNQQLFTLTSYSSIPYTSLLFRDYYRSTAFKDDVAEYTQAIHSRGRKVKLQNQLAKQLAESKYSGKVGWKEKNSTSMYKPTKDTVRWVANSNIIDNSGTALDIVGTSTMFVNSVGVKVGPNNGFVIGNASNMQNFSNASQTLSQIGRYAKPIMYARFAIGMADDMLNNNKTVGQVFAHNATSMPVSYLAGAGATAGVSYLATTSGVGFLASNPIGWGLAAALAGGYVASKAFDAAYENNFLGIRDGLDFWGSVLRFGCYRYR